MNRLSIYLSLTAMLLGMAMASSGISTPSAALAVDAAAARDAARDPNLVLTRVPVRRDADRETARSLGTVVADYGSFVVVAARPETIEAAGRQNRDVATIDTIISLRGFQFEPLGDDPASRFAAEGGYKA